MPSVSCITESKQQGETSKKSPDYGTAEASKVEITNDIVLTSSPVIPAPALESDSIPALRRKCVNSVGEDKAHPDIKCKPVVNLCRIPRSLLKAPEEKASTVVLEHAREADEIGKVAAPHQQSVAMQQKSNRNSGLISEFAKQVRLHVKRVTRHGKLNVYHRRARKPSCAKTLAAKELLPIAGKGICPDTVSGETVLEDTQSCGRAASTPKAQEPCHPYQKGIDALELEVTWSVGHAVYTPKRRQPSQAKFDESKTSILLSLEESSKRDCTDAESGYVTAVNDSLDLATEPVSQGCTQAEKLANLTDCLPAEPSDVDNSSPSIAKEKLPDAEQMHVDAGVDKKVLEDTQSYGKAGSTPKTQDCCHSCVDELPGYGSRALGDIGNAVEMQERTQSKEEGPYAYSAVFSEGSDRRNSKGSGDHCGSESVPGQMRVEIDRDTDIPFREYSQREYSARGRRPAIIESFPLCVSSGHAASESSDFDTKGHTGRAHEQVPERASKLYRWQARDRSSNIDESTEGSEYSGSLYGRRHEMRGASSQEPLEHFSPCSPVRGALLMDQVLPGMCDAEGNVWGTEKRTQRGDEAEDDLQAPGPPKVRYKEQRTGTFEHQGCQQPGSVGTELPAQGLLPYSHLVQLKWKYPVFDGTSDLPCSPMVRLKERSIFVGCIPDGVPNLEQVLQNLMDKFLERFDFAPASLGLIQLVKTVKDVAFIELASDKVAQIVLAANQLDVFEWGISGFHFNIQGCTQTTTSVRPAIEYLPLRPARVIYVGNIPKSRWRREYLEVFFSRMLQGSDGSSGVNYVVSIYLLPDSSDAYVELASELMADAVIFKCTKDPEILADIGDEVLLCRDVSAVPLMSRHRVSICPQRTLFIGVTPRSELFKIDTVVKLFLEILPFIARERNQPGYLEYVGIQPGKEFAFFQFSSEGLADAIMDEYIENTQIFLCRAAFILLRLPEYVRPGAVYRSGSHGTKLKLPHMLDTSRAPERIPLGEKCGDISYGPRRFGDEPIKKPDSIVSLGVSRPPLVTWNGMPFGGGRASDPQCMLIVEGLPRGLNYKLVRGALNELFERLLSESGLMEAGTYVVRYLARYGHFEFVASLPSTEFVCALLSMQRTFMVAGGEVRLQPVQHNSFEWRSSPAHYVGNGSWELCSLSDEESQGRKVIKSGTADRWPHSKLKHKQRKRGHSEIDDEYPPGFDTITRGPVCDWRNSRHDMRSEWDRADLSHDAYNLNKVPRGAPQETSQQWMGSNDQTEWGRPLRSEMHGPRSMEDLHCLGNNPRFGVSQGPMGTSSMLGGKWSHPSAGQGGSGRTMGFSLHMGGGRQYH